MRAKKANQELKSFFKMGAENDFLFIDQPNHIYAGCVNDFLVRTTVVQKNVLIIISFPDLTSFHFGVGNSPKAHRALTTQSTLC